METWRLIRDSPRDAASNLSIDEILLKKINDNEMENSLKFNYFSPPAVILGINQDILNLNLKFIKEKEFDLNRRLTGGAAILIGYPNHFSQMGISFFLSKSEKIPSKLSAIFKLFGNLLIESLKRFNLQLTYNRNSDILIGGRKIIGNGIYMMENAFLFHSVVLLEFDFPTTSQILKQITERKIDIQPESLKGIPTSLKNEVNIPYSTEEIENDIITTMEKAWNIKFIEKQLSSEEISLSKTKILNKYGNNEWIYQKNEKLVDYGSCFIPKEINI
ncbi:MAG: lipoate--protein ligase family protein [Candidatus Helarchaeota archaeon]